MWLLAGATFLLNALETIHFAHHPMATGARRLSLLRTKFIAVDLDIMVFPFGADRAASINTSHIRILLCLLFVFVGGDAFHC